MNIARFLTKRLPLLFRAHACKDGPMQGQKLILTENTPATAWLVVNGQVGRYVADQDTGALRWEAYHG